MMNQTGKIDNLINNSTPMGHFSEKNQKMKLSSMHQSEITYIFIMFLLGFNKYLKCLFIHF